VAYCDSSVSPDDVKSIQLIHNWPGFGGNATKEKVPSQIAYGNFDDGENELWGGLIPPGVPRQVWLKLRLDEPNNRQGIRQLWHVLTGGMNNLDLADDDSSDSSDDNPPSYPGKQPVDMIADYLRAVNAHVLTVLTAQFSDAMLRTMAIEVVVTVPAVWSDKAKHLTFKAVREAGFGPYDFEVSMVTEPEAAATWALKALKAESGRDDIKVCDIGVLKHNSTDGVHRLQTTLCFVMQAVEQVRTFLLQLGCPSEFLVDLISYKVRSVYPHFHVEEAAIGTGTGAHNSTFGNLSNILKGLSVGQLISIKASRNGSKRGLGKQTTNGLRKKGLCRAAGL